MVDFDLKYVQLVDRLLLALRDPSITIPSHSHILQKAPWCYIRLLGGIFRVEIGVSPADTTRKLLSRPIISISTLGCSVTK